MAQMSAVLEVLVHGEADRDKVNQLARNAAIAGLRGAQGLTQSQAAARAGDPDMPADILLTLRDAEGRRVEWPIIDWGLVEVAKALVGWDRVWTQGAKLLVTITPAPPPSAG